MAITQGNWCHIWNEHMKRWEVRVAAAFGARVAIVVAPDDNQAFSDAKLLACSKLLLAMVREYASRCDACGGSAEIVGNDQNGHPAFEHAVECSSCKRILDLVREAT